MLDIRGRGQVNGPKAGKNSCKLAEQHDVDKVSVGTCPMSENSD